MERRRQLIEEFHRVIFQETSSGKREKFKQDGRLAPAYFSPNYKYFDQLLQTVENKTTVLILVFKEFLQKSIRPLISVLYAKGYHDFPLKHFCLTVQKISSGNPSLFQKISGTEKCQA